MPRKLSPALLGWMDTMRKHNCIYRSCGISGVGSRYSPVGSPLVWWLELGAFTAMTWVQPAVGALRSCKLRGVAKKRKKYSAAEDLTNGRTHQPPGFLQLLCFSPTYISLSVCIPRLEPACLPKGKGDVTVSVCR